MSQTAQHRAFWRSAGGCGGEGGLEELGWRMEVGSTEGVGYSQTSSLFRHRALTICLSRIITISARRQGTSHRVLTFAKEGITLALLRPSTRYHSRTIMAL